MFQEILHLKCFGYAAVNMAFFSKMGNDSF